MKGDLLLELRDDVGYIGIRGTGTFQSAGAVKNFFHALLLESVEKWTVDLDGCTGLDSTMLGTLTGLALKLKEVSAAPVRVIHCHAQIAALMHNLGLDRLFAIETQLGAE